MKRMLSTDEEHLVQSALDYLTHEVGTNLTSWEIEFLTSIENQFKAMPVLSQKQIDKLLDIRQKYVEQGISDARYS